MLVEVTISQIEEAAAKIAKQNEMFRDAVESLKGATNALGSEWEGSAHNKFDGEMATIFSWYDEMAQIVDGYVKMMNEFATNYADTDSQAASIIRKR